MAAAVAAPPAVPVPERCVTGWEAFSGTVIDRARKRLAGPPPPPPFPFPPVACCCCCCCSCSCICAAAAAATAADAGCRPVSNDCGQAKHNGNYASGVHRTAGPTPAKRAKTSPQHSRRLRAQSTREQAAPHVTCRGPRLTWPDGPALWGPPLLRACCSASSSAVSASYAASLRGETWTTEGADEHVKTTATCSFHVNPCTAHSCLLRACMESSYRIISCLAQAATQPPIR